MFVEVMENKYKPCIFNRLEYLEKFALVFGKTITPFKNLFNFIKMILSIIIMNHFPSFTLHGETQPSFAS